jgi:hypothetical protein
LTCHLITILVIDANCNPNLPHAQSLTN